MSGSVIEDGNNEIVSNPAVENTDPDPSMVGQRSAKRIRRNTVLATFFVFGILGALAIFGLLVTRVNANAAKQRAQAMGSTESYAADAHPMTGDDEEDASAGDAGSGNSAGAGYDRNHKYKKGRGGSSADGDSDSSPEPSSSPGALDQERQNEAVEQQRAEFEAENQQRQVTQDAIAADGRVALASYQSSAQTSETSSETSTPTSTPDPNPTPVRKTSHHFKLVAGRDFLEGIIYPNINAEAKGIIGIYIYRPKKDSGGSVTLVPRGAYLLGIPADASVGQSRIQLSSPLLVMPHPSNEEIDLASIAADADGTSGLSAKVDDHHWKILEYALIGGALSGLANALSPQTVIVNGVAATQTNAGVQTLNGAGQGGLQAAAQLARVTQPPTLTDPHAKHVIIYLEKDLYLDPYCDGTQPDSPECIVDEELKAEGAI